MLCFYRDFCRSCPDEMVAAGAMMTSPDGAPVAVIVVGYIGDLAAGGDERADAGNRKRPDTGEPAQRAANDSARKPARCCALGRFCGLFDR